METETWADKSVWRIALDRNSLALVCGYGHEATAGQGLYLGQLKQNPSQERGTPPPVLGS